MEIKQFNLSKQNLPYFIAKLEKLDLSLGYVADVKIKSKTRNQLQNDSYWQFIKEFCEYLGYEKDMLHDILRYKFLYEITEIEGKEHRRLLSTTKQSVKEMAAYIEKCLMFASENGFYFEFKH